MLIEHRGAVPCIHPDAYVAPNAVVCGDVEIGADSRILFGAVITAEGGPVRIGRRCVVMEQAVLRGAPRCPLILGDNVLVGPRGYLVGCTVANNAFLATGCAVFNGAAIGEGAEVRINGTVHLRTTLAAGATVPIGWVAVGNPARILPPERHDEIWEAQKPLDFPRFVFGLDRPPEGQTIMPEMMARYTCALGRHRDDRVVEATPPGQGAPLAT
ncbi:MAG: gamma carbonic anhydrase family protein [Azospirillum sp.]|nr:gamma carbonic anhydrase family protein [Azospirillum sp.]